jgi:hypothetical protein
MKTGAKENQVNNPKIECRSFFDELRAFFFTPSSAHVLAVIRIATGCMIAYIHLIWMLNLESFLGPFALIDNETWQALHRGQVSDSKWTYLAYTESMAIIWFHEIFACLAGLLLAAGFFTRAFSILAWFTTLMTVHRMTGMLFGLDQITIMLAMYLCLGRPGSVWSVDQWLHSQYPIAFENHRWLRRMSGVLAMDCGTETLHCWSNTFATRLIQLHLCVIYLFGGLGKLRGEMWWDGSAMWFSIAAYEYQSLDMTWMGHFPLLCSMATHLTLFWEVGYCAIVWPRWLRPWTLLVACFVHGGIALFLGMFTFGFMMLVANFAFVSPIWLQRWGRERRV